MILQHIAVIEEKVMQSVCFGTNYKKSDIFRLKIVKKHTSVIPDKKKIVKIMTTKVYFAFLITIYRMLKVMHVNKVNNI